MLSVAGVHDRRVRLGLQIKKPFLGTAFFNMQVIAYLTSTTKYLEVLQNSSGFLMLMLAYLVSLASVIS